MPGFEVLFEGDQGINLIFMFSVICQRSRHSLAWQVVFIRQEVC